MKTFLGSSLLTFGLLLLASCGAQKSATTLQITNSALTTSNSSYPGGLVIMGKSASGNFTAPIAVGSGSTNSVTIDLTKDTWTFSAIGWNGSLFRGNSVCDSQTIKIDQDTQAVNLKLTSANCTSGAFGPASYYQTTSFKELRVATCGWLYTTPALAPVDATTASNYCGTGATFGAEWKTYAKAVKIEVPNVLNGVVTSGLSDCLTTGSNGELYATGFNLPTEGLPLKVTLYDNNSCASADDKIAEYQFPKGMTASTPDQDTFVNNPSSTTNLFLPANDTRRGYSSLISSMPVLNCNGSPCVGIPSTSSAQRTIQSGSDFLILANPTATQTCANIFSVTETGGGFSPSVAAITDLNCWQENGHLTGRINFSGMSSPTLTITFNDASTVTLTFAQTDLNHFYSDAFDKLGFNPAGPTDPNVRDSFRQFYENNDEKKFGVLSNVHDFFGPQGPAGVLGSVSCMTAVTENTVSFEEDGVMKTYRIRIKASPAVVSANVADGTNPASTPYHRRMIIQRLQAGSFTTEAVMDFMCNYQQGRLEQYEVKPERVENKIVEWNTQSSSYGLVFEYKLEKELDPAVKRISTSYTKIQKLGGAGSAQVNVWELNIERQANGTFDYRPRRSQIKTDSANTSYLESAGTTLNFPLTTDVTFATSLATAEITPNTQCATVSPIFASQSLSACSTVGTSFLGTFTNANLAPGTFAGQFTSSAVFQGIQ